MPELERKPLVPEQERPGAAKERAPAADSVGVALLGLQRRVETLQWRRSCSADKDRPGWPLNP